MYRGRGSHRGRGFPQSHRGGRASWRSQPELFPEPPTGSLIESLSLDHITANTAGDSDDYVGISDVKLIASYNLMNSRDPEIMIPGKYILRAYQKPCN
jgi:hypothetical protein